MFLNEVWRLILSELKENSKISLKDFHQKIILKYKDEHLKNKISDWNWFEKNLRGMREENLVHISEGKITITTKGAKAIGVDDEAPLSFRNLYFPTKHLAFFKGIDELTKLYGREYTLIKKGSWYFIHSLPLQKRTVSLGDISTDCRFHLMIPLPSGAGKENLGNMVKKVADGLDLVVAKPVSLHAEQLVGKTIRRRDRSGFVFEQNPGHLADDVVIFDEGIELIRSSDQGYKEARKYLNEALDYYPNNTIVKRMVDVSREEQLSYTPTCNVLLFFQPYSMSEEVILVGFFRRFFVIFSKVKQYDFSRHYKERVLGVSKTDKDFEQLVSHLNKIKISVKDFKISDDAKNRFIELHKELIWQGKIHSKKGSNYTSIIDFTLQDRLLKMSAIQAAARGSETIEVGDVERAYVDLVEFFAAELEFIQQRVFGDLDYGQAWLGAKNQDKECLLWLFENNAISEESSNITIQDYWNKISEIYNVGEEMAKKHYYKHREKGWIGSRQVGQYGSRLWLKFQPQDSKGDKDSNLILKDFFDTEYYKIIERLYLDDDHSYILGRLNSDTGYTQIIQNTLLPLQPLPPSTDIKDKILELLPINVETKFAKWEESVINSGIIKDPTECNISFWEYVREWEKEKKILLKDGSVIRRF